MWPCWPPMPVPPEGRQFSVPMRELAHLGHGGFDVADSSGSGPMLYVATDMVLGRRMLGLMMMQADSVQSTPIATVGQRLLLEKEVPAILGGLEIYGPSGDLYGSLESHGQGTYTAKDKVGNQLLFLRGNRPKMEISATGSRSEEQLISAAQQGDFFEVQVKPGADPVLALLCVFAILLFFDCGKTTTGKCTAEEVQQVVASSSSGSGSGSGEGPVEDESPLAFALSLG